MNIDKSELEAFVSRERGAFEDLLRKFVEVPSISADPTRKGDVERVAELGAATIRGFGGMAELHRVEGGNPIVLGSFEAGPGLPTVTIYNHLDVQPASEKASIQLRTFIDKITTAPRGYAGLFDAVKINEPELQALYQFDYAFFDLSDQVGRALDNVEASMGDEDGLPAAIRNVTSLARLAVETYNRRTEAFTGSGR